MTPTQQAAWDAAVALYKARLTMLAAEERALWPRADARDLAAVQQAQNLHAKAALDFQYAMDDYEREERAAERKVA